jgi:CheY-like chemotaxis protein
MVQTVLILCPDRDYANRFRQKLIGSVLPQGQIDIETDPFRSLQPSSRQYNIVIVDPMVSNLDGLQLLVLLKQRMPNAQIVVLSQSELYQQEAIRLGSDLFLLKPTTKEEWQEALDEFAKKFLPETAGNHSTTGTQKLDRIDLEAILRLECQGGKTTMVQFSNSDIPCEIFIFEGEIFHAQAPGASGEEAFHVILEKAVESGSVKLYPLKSRPPRTIETPWKQLLGEPPEEITSPSDFPSEENNPASELTQVTDLAPAQEMETEAPELSATPTAPELRTAAHSLPPTSVWKIDMIGNMLDHTNLPDPLMAANLTYYLMRKFSDIAVALDMDDLSRLTLKGPLVIQEVYSGDLCVQHALFDSGTATETDRLEFIETSHASSL